MRGGRECKECEEIILGSLTVEKEEDGAGAEGYAGLKESLIFFF